MRLPTHRQVTSVVTSSDQHCAFPCEYTVWTALAGCGSYGCPTSSDSTGGWTQYMSLKTDARHDALCVSGDAVEWTYHDGLGWSELSEKGDIWTKAYNACTEIGGELPTINELRTLIQNCPLTETGGSCPSEITVRYGTVEVNGEVVRSYGGVVPGCEGCDEATDGRYSALGDGALRLWSATKAPGDYDNKLYVNFTQGNVGAMPAYNTQSAWTKFRCVKRTTAAKVND